MSAPRSEQGKTDFLADYLDVEPFADEVDRHPRTIHRWMNEPNGLPYTKIGNRRLIHVPTAREWLLSRVRRPNARRGRPRELSEG